ETWGGRWGRGESGGDARQSIVLPLSQTILEGGFLTLEKAFFIEPLPEECNQRRVDSRRTTAEQSDHWQCTLLRMRRERPGNRRSDCHLDEIASSHRLPQGLGPRQLHR